MSQLGMEQKRPFPWAILGALVFFGILWSADFPKPIYDDLFYNGAALNMAGGGDYSNPLLIRQEFPSHYFFVYPPFHPYAVYGWISLFGINAASLLAFQNVMYFIIAAMMILILRRYKAPELLSWLVPLGVTAAFLKQGLRPEAFAVAMTMAGYTLFLYYREKGIWLGISFLMMFLGAMAAPRTAFFGAAFVLAGSWERLKMPPADRFSRLWFGMMVGLALAAAVAIFLMLIRFRLAEFYHTFHLHSTRLNCGKLSLLRVFMAELGAKSWPLLILTIILAGIALRRPGGEAERVCYWLAMAFFVAGLIGGLGFGSSWYLNFIFFLLAAVLVKRLSHPRAILLNMAVVLALLGANSTHAVEVFGLVTGRIQHQAPENRAAVLAMQSTKEHPVLLDGSTARYVFDYKLPSVSIDYEFAAPFPKLVATDTPLRGEDLFVLGPGSVGMLNAAIHASYPAERWTWLGIKNYSQFKYPCRALVIPARDCLAMPVKNFEEKP